MIPNVAEVTALQKILNQSITLKLFSNNVTPAEGNTASSYTEVVGGGYVAKILSYGGWTIVAGSPTTGTYAIQDFNFSGVTNAPGTVYGYYMIDGAGVLLGAETFPGGPYTPIANSLIRITPKISAE